MRPDGARGRWLHECVRALGRLDGLNLVVLRTGEVYGPGYAEGSVLARLVIGHVYKHLCVRPGSKRATEVDRQADTAARR